MAPKSKSGSLKQQSLSFQTRRSTAASHSNAKVKGSKASTVPSSPTPSSVQDIADVDEIDSVSLSSTRSKLRSASGKQAAGSKKRKLAGEGDASDVDVDTNTGGEVKEKERKAVFKSRASLENAKPAAIDILSSDDEPELPEALDTSPKARKGRMLRHYSDVRQKMGHLEPIHGQGLKTEHHILRVFDLSYEYGPCIGMTRLERWERAKAMGLNPPITVKEILESEQANDNHKMDRCVFHGEV